MMNTKVAAPASFLNLPVAGVAPTICSETPAPGFLEFVKERFDGVWVSSLTNSFLQHLPDNMSLPWTHYVEFVTRIRSVDAHVPIVCDVDALAGDPAVAAMIAQRYAMAGADAIVIEDKNASAKTNSLFATTKKAIPLVTPEEMCKKLRACKQATIGTRTKIVARTEYLPRNMDNPQLVVDIAKKYHTAGADVIMVHNGKENDNLEPLKYVLTQLRDAGIPTMIVPQGFTPRAVSGEFDELTGTIILGNVVTSKILELMDLVTREDLLVKPKFGGLLQKSNEITPKTRAMIVLGGKARPDGQFMLNSEKVRSYFEVAANRMKCSDIVFLSGAECGEKDTTTTKYPVLKGSLGEVHSLKVALSAIPYTDEVLVVYADETVPQFDGVGQSSWYGDRFKGSMLVDSGELAVALDQVSSEDYLIDVLSNMKTQRVHYAG